MRAKIFLLSIEGTKSTNTNKYFNIQLSNTRAKRITSLSDTRKPLEKISNFISLTPVVVLESRQLHKC